MRRLKFSGKAAICLAVMAISALAVFLARNWQFQTALFPIVIGITVFLLSVPTLIFIITEKEEAPGVQAIDGQPSGDPEVVRRKTLAAFGCVVGFFLLILLFGFPIAIPLFVLFYTRFVGQENWWISLTATFLAWLFFWALFIRLLHIRFGEGLMQQGFRLL